MTNFPDLSALPVHMAVEGLLQQLFQVRSGPPKDWEEGLPIADEELKLKDGTWARCWGNGPYILLAHGFEGRWSQWTPLASRLLDRGASFITLEMPGHGRADTLPSTPLAFSGAIHAAALYFGTFKAVVGHSQGAIAAMHAVANDVDAERLIMMAPVASIEAHLRRVCALVKLSKDGTDAFIQRVTDHVGVAPSEFDATSLAKDVNIPTLILHDEQDREAPFNEVHQLTEAWQSATLYPSSGLGHRRLMNDADVLRTITTFLSAG